MTTPIELLRKELKTLLLDLEQSSEAVKSKKITIEEDKKHIMNIMPQIYAFQSAIFILESVDNIINFVNSNK
ncbi:MAG: hypothetical protein PHT07_21580 [Paludibacter sp.]|nr:hypothetical protein [Paludibacter sp.]